MNRAEIERGMHVRWTDIGAKEVIRTGVVVGTADTDRMPLFVRTTVSGEARLRHVIVERVTDAWWQS